MAWLEAHQELRDHPKTKRAARMLGISKPQMIGHLLCLWWWCLDYVEDGDLSDFEIADIAEAAEWDGKPEVFIAALVGCGPANRNGFLVDTEGRLEVNDWAQYGGKYITKRNQGRDRQRAYRERNADVTRYSRVSNTTRSDQIREEEIIAHAPQNDAVAAYAARWQITPTVKDGLIELETTYGAQKVLEAIAFIIQAENDGKKISYPNRYLKTILTNGGPSKNGAAYSIPATAAILQEYSFAKP